MSVMDNFENIKEQYKDDNNLSIRIKLHAKHSTNKQGFIPWLFEKYKFSMSKWRDYKDSNRQKLMTVTAEEFILWRIKDL